MTATTLRLTSSQKITIELSRVGLFVLVLAAALVSFLFQPRFINWTVLAPLYLGVGISLLLHVIYILFLERFYEFKPLLFFSFLADSVFISALIYSSGQNQSLFLFLHLANIILAGLLFQSRGAYIVALFTSLSFTLVSLLSLELKGLNYVFVLFLNNTSFFLVGGLSGFLSDQLYFVGKKLKETGRELQNLSELNQAIVENSPLAILTFDREGHVFHRNPEAVKFFGLQLADKNFFSVLGEAVLPSFTGTGRWQKQVTLKSGEKRDMQILIKPLKENDQNHFLALLEDRTDMIRLEERLRQNEKLAAIGGLAAGIAHEIRNPLAGISGSIEMLSQSTSNEDDKKLMQIVLREIDRLNNLITEFLDYSRPELPPTEKTNLSQLLTEVVAVAAKDRGIPAGLRYDVEIKENLFISGRGDKLRQAFLNIIINSYQAMVSSATPILKVSADRAGSEVVLRIQDNGCGMSAEVQKRVFEPFFTTKSKGTGLGLAMTHKIFQTHQARVSLESEPGRGTTFEIIFPGRID